MTKKEVILLLRRQGMSLRKIAKKSSACKSYVCNVIKVEREKMFEADENIDEGENND